MFRFRAAFEYLARLAVAGAVAGTIGWVAANPAFAEGGSEAVAGWELERGVKMPSYAVVDPESTNLNIDSVVVTCEQGTSRIGLQLQLYLSSVGPLAPKGAQRLKSEPEAEADIDGARFPVGLFFAGDHVVVADDADANVPMLSDALLDAMQSGHMMVLRFDLLAETAGEPAAFDGNAVIDLQAGMGGAALATVRRCAGKLGIRSAGLAGVVR